MRAVALLALALTLTPFPAAANDLTREGVKKNLEASSWDFAGMYEGKTFSYASHKVPMARIFKASAAQNQWNPITPWMNVDEELK